MDKNNDVILSRLDRVRDSFDDWQIDALLIGGPSNRRWLSGFSGSFGWLLVSRERALLMTDFRYWQQARKEAPLFELTKEKRDKANVWPELMSTVDAKKVGLEAEYVTLQQFAEIREAVSIEWVEINDGLGAFRQEKDEVELAAIRKAAQIADRTMDQVIQLLIPGITERELAWQLEIRLHDYGAQSSAFPIIVAAGPNGAMAHHSPSDRPIEAGDPVIVDLGACVDGYNSDLTRTFLAGDAQNDRFNELYRVVLEALENTIAGLKAGKTGEAIDRLAREIIAEAGYGPNFGHPVGHGVGLDVHERPKLSKLATDELVPVGATVTIEPGIYLEGWGGIRLEDLLLVTENGSELLSKSSKNNVISGF